MSLARLERLDSALLAAADDDDWALAGAMAAERDVLIRGLAGSLDAAALTALSQRNERLQERLSVRRQQVADSLSAHRRGQAAAAAYQHNAAPLASDK